jgi:dienelactone hydrolase
MTCPKTACLVIAMLSSWTIFAPLCAQETSAKPVERIQIPLTPLPFDLTGYLRRPNGAGPFPGAVLVPACGRFGSSVDRTWGETLSSWGYVALTLDIFTAHGMSDQTACRFSAARPELAEDAYRGLDLLVERKLLDARRVFIIGFGQGGSLAFAAVGRDGVVPNAKHKFRAAVALYPACGDVKDVMAQTLVIVGARDERTLDGCRRMAAGEDDMGISRRPDAGAPIQLVVLPGAYAGFDIPAFQKPANVYGLHLEYSKAATDEAKDVLLQFFQSIAAQAQ